MSHLSIDLLGPLQVYVDDKQITTLESVKVRALLAFLVVEADRSHTRESLVGLLWPDYTEESARHNLRQALFNLRSTLEGRTSNSPYFLVSRDSIQFNRASDYSLDIEQFNDYFFTCEEKLPQCVEDCSTHASRLEEMVKLYRGEFLQQLSVDDSTEFEEWLLVQREGLHQRMLEAHHYLANYNELRSDFRAARFHAVKQLELDPWREEAHRQLMRVLALNGERSAALAQYETCKRVLADELDIEPATETRELYEQIRLGTIKPNNDRPFPIPATAANNLPIQLTPFIGRELETEQLGALIADTACRCITLLGPGGIGKTRLATHVVREHLKAFADGVAFIPLASVNSFAGVIPAITNAINLSIYSAGDPRPHLLSYLHEKQMLLIFDNLEHLLIEGPLKEDVIELVVEILENCPQVTLLITSREALNLQEEWIYEVHGLSFPEDACADGIDEYDAIALFYQRARRANVSFMLNGENRSDIARICQLVEGMPLAIELAASWIRTLTPFEIAEEIDNGLDFLSSSLRDLPERHRSLRVVFDHSWDILTSGEQQVLAKLSVFRGSFQRQAAEQVAGASLSLLSMLVNRTLLRRSSEGRYDLHELVRQYCATRLASDPNERFRTQERHYNYYLTLAEAADKELKGRNQLEWLGKLEQDHDNLRVALEWAIESSAIEPVGVEQALRLTAALRWFWRMRGHFHEGYDWLQEALQRCKECSVGSRGVALLGTSLLMNALGDLGAARGPAEESVKIFRELGDRPHLAESLMIAGLTMLWQGEADSGQAMTREALAVYREVGDRWGEAQALYRLGSYLSDYGGDLAGRAMLEESATILESIGEKFLYTSILIALGIVDLSHGDYDAAMSRFEMGLVSTKEIKHPWGIADALTNVGCLYRIRGDYEKAQSCFNEALQVYHEHGRNIWEVDALCAMAENAILQGDLDTAQLDLSSATSILGTSENKWLQALVLFFQGELAYYRGDYNQAVELLDKSAELARDGQFKPDLARSLVTLSLVRMKLGDVEHANEAARDGLALFWKFGHRLGVVTALEALAEMDIVKARYESATMLFAVGQNMRQVLGAVRAPIDCDGHDSMIAFLQAQLGETRFNDLWSHSDTKPLDLVVGEILKNETHA